MENHTPTDDADTAKDDVVAEFEAEADIEELLWPRTLAAVPADLADA